MTQIPSPKSLPKDYFRYLSIICILVLILLSLTIISSWKDSSFYLSVENPWHHGDGIFTALGALGFIITIYGLVFLTVVCSLILTLFTVLNYLSAKPTYRKKQYYYITLVIGCLLLILMIAIPIGTQIRTTTIQNSYIEIIQQENDELTANINILGNDSSVQVLGSYSFQYHLTYMYVIAVEDQPLPTKEFELDFSFNDSTSNESHEVEWWESFSTSQVINPKNLRNSIELVIDSKNYYYIITDYRLFFDKQFSDNTMINCNLTCSVNQSELAPDLIDFQIKLLILEDYSDTIRKGAAELNIIESDPVYALWLVIPSILGILISLVNIRKYPDSESY